MGHPEDGTFFECFTSKCYYSLSANINVALYKYVNKTNRCRALRLSKLLMLVEMGIEPNFHERTKLEPTATEPKSPNPNRIL